MKRLSELNLKEKILLVILLLIGCLFLITSVRTMVGRIMYEETMGEVANIEHYRMKTTRQLFNRDLTKVTIAYYVDGNRYEADFTEHEDSSAYRVGMERKVYYNPNHPQDSFTEMDVGMLIATPCVLAGLIFWSFLILKKRE